MTYTTQGNAGSLNHRTGPGIKPTSSWILVGFGFITTEPEEELLGLHFLHFVLHVHCSLKRSAFIRLWFVKTQILSPHIFYNILPFPISLLGPYSEFQRGNPQSIWFVLELNRLNLGHWPIYRVTNSPSQASSWVQSAVI